MRNYIRKTDRGKTPVELLQRAADAVQDGRKVRSVARELGICHVTLGRYIKKLKAGVPPTMGYYSNRVFYPDQEKALAEHLLKYLSIYSGLLQREMRKLAYNCALKLNFPNIPVSWRNNQIAGDDWFKSFMIRNPSFRTSIMARTGAAFNSNLHNVSEFFTKLGDVILKRKLLPSRIWNLDETEVTTFVALKGIKQIDAIASMEQRTFVTIELAVSAAGTNIPPMFVFPRPEYNYLFIRYGPPGCIGAGNNSGSMTTTAFLTFMDHFINHTKPTPEDPVLLLLDNHSSHVDVNVVDKADANSIILLSFPSYCTHKLQPLEVGVNRLFKTGYAKAQENWLRNNPGKAMSIYEIPEIVKQALPLGATSTDIMNAFRKVGISPYNPDIIITNENFPPMNSAAKLSSRVTDHLMPDVNTPKENNLNLEPQVQETIEAEVPLAEHTKAIRPSEPHPKMPETIYVEELQPGPSNNVLKPAMSNEQQFEKQIVLQDNNPRGDDRKDDMKWDCIICLDPYSNSQPKEEWIECVLCKKWAHLECLESDDTHSYVCAFCSSADNETFKL